VKQCVWLVALVACGKDAPPSTSTSTTEKPWTCEQMPFAESTPVPEASAAAWWKLDGKDVLVAVGDSGQHGAYGVIDPDTGATGEQGALPLGDAGDDLEGLSALGDRLYGLTSAGWMRVWKRDGDAFALVDGPYAIGDGKMICDKQRSNCARDYEGLCLRPKPAAGASACAGYAASRTDGALYCLTQAEQGYRVDPARKISIVAHKGVVADCTYDDAGALWVGNNLFGNAQIYRVDGDAEPEHAKVVPIAQIGLGFPEVVAVRGDVIWRMSDAGGTPSLMSKFRCRPAAR
jgi:hypothetical protein